MYFLMLAVFCIYHFCFEKVGSRFCKYFLINQVPIFVLVVQPILAQPLILGLWVQVGENQIQVSEQKNKIGIRIIIMCSDNFQLWTQNRGLCIFLVIGGLPAKVSFCGQIWMIFASFCVQKLGFCNSFHVVMMWSKFGFQCEQFNAVVGFGCDDFHIPPLCDVDAEGIQTQAPQISKQAPSHPPLISKTTSKPVTSCVKTSFETTWFQNKIKWHKTRDTYGSKHKSSNTDIHIRWAGGEEPRSNGVLQLRKVYR
jgi:hypothetical protein